LDTGKKIMFLVRKVVFQSGNPISTTCFSIPEEFVGVGSFARLPSALHEYSTRHTRRPSEEFLREAPASHEKGASDFEKAPIRLSASKKYVRPRAGE
jgi:hypothetical protein